MIEIRDLSLEAPDGRLLVEALDLAVPQGSTCLLTGSSGGGKSRLLKVISGVERPTRGQVRVGGLDVWPGEGALGMGGKVRVGFAFASGGLLSNLSLRGNLVLPLRFSGLSVADIQARVAASLDRLGLSGVASLRPHAVSLSARKHGNLARVLALDPDLILLDEPLEGLDSSDRATAVALIRGWAADPDKTLVMALEQPGPFADLEAIHLNLNPLPVPLETS